MSTGRLGYIDAMRGFTMILVVYSHVAIMMLSNTPPHLLSNVNEVFIRFRMPLFFFISGYFAYSAFYDWGLFKKRSVNRLVKQFYPTVIVWLIYCMIFREGNLLDWAFEAYKSGYWFTFVSVELFFTVIPFLLLFSKFNVPMWRRSIYLLLLCATVMVIYLTIMNFTWLNGFLDLMSIGQYYSYILFFVIGMIAKIHLEQFNRFCSNTVCVLGCLIMFGMLIIYPPYNTITGWTSSITGIIIVYSMFYYLGKLQRPIVSKLLSRLSIIGTSTLEIYLLHYFFISVFMKTLDLSFLASVSGTAAEFPIFFVLSIFICVLCLLSVGILKKLHVYRFLFPSAPSIKTGIATCRQ